jgi:hypothetical protein
VRAFRVSCLLPAQFARVGATRRSNLSDPFPFSELISQVPLVAMVNEGEKSAITAAVHDVERGGARRRAEEGSQCFSDAEDLSLHSQSRQESSVEDCISLCASVGRTAAADAAERGGKSCLSECSLDDVDLEAGVAEITKASPDKAESICRICHLGLESAAAESGTGIVLGCSCKDDLARAHQQCAETWFKIRGNK